MNKKIQAFREELSEFIRFSNESMMEMEGQVEGLKIANVISIGDSHHEREALHVVTSEWENLLVKSVKFVERPDMDVLQKQLELVHGCIEYICQHNDNLDLMLSRALLSSPSHANSIPGNWSTSSSASSSSDDLNGIAAANGL